jgi:hypothetical protein
MENTQNIQLERLSTTGETRPATISIVSKLAQTVTFLVFIQELSGYNPVRDIDYPDSEILWFSSVHSGECWDSTLN